jgi:hypothetical protein
MVAEVYKCIDASPMEKAILVILSASIHEPREEKNEKYYYIYTTISTVNILKTPQSPVVFGLSQVLLETVVLKFSLLLFFPHPFPFHSIFHSIIYMMYTKCTIHVYVMSQSIFITKRFEPGDKSIS